MIVESHGNEHKNATADGYVLNGNLFLSNLTSKPNWTKSDYDIVSLISEWEKFIKKWKLVEKRKRTKIVIYLNEALISHCIIIFGTDTHFCFSRVSNDFPDSQK